MDKFSALEVVIFKSFATLHILLQFLCLFHSFQIKYVDGWVLLTEQLLLLINIFLPPQLFFKFLNIKGLMTDSFLRLLDVPFRPKSSYEFVFD